MRGGLSDLLLDPNSFLSQPRYRSLLDLWEHHSLQQLFDGMNGLIGFFHHTFQLCLLARYLGKVSLSVLRCLLLSGPLGRVGGKNLILTFKWLVLSQVLGTSSHRRYGQRAWLLKLIELLDRERMGSSFQHQIVDVRFWLSTTMNKKYSKTTKKL